MGEELKKIMNVAKSTSTFTSISICSETSFVGAKRIGLLFSGAEIDYVVSDRIGDIGDLMVGDENFSDGCGLISKWLRFVPTEHRRCSC